MLLAKVATALQDSLSIEIVSPLCPFLLLRFDRGIPELACLLLSVAKNRTLIIMDHAQESSRRPPQPPPDFAAVAEPTSILQTSNKLCENFQQVVNKLVRTVTPENATFNNVVRQLLQHENEMQLTSNLITMIAIVSPDKTLRNSAS